MLRDSLVRLCRVLLVETLMLEKANRFSGILERSANFATIVAAMAVCFAVVRQTIWPRNPIVLPAQQPPYAAGERLTGLSDVDFAAAPQTVVLFVRSSCHFCELSMPFYKALSNSPLRKNGAFRLVVASTESPAATREYLKQNQVAVDQIVDVPLGRTKIHGTPTLLLVDRTAAVVKSWMGLLPRSGEEELMNRLSARKL